MKRLLLVCLLLAFPWPASPCRAEDSPQLSLRLGKTTWLTPFLVPGYSPEMGANLAAGNLLRWSLTREDSTLVTSTLANSLVVATGSAVSLSSELTSYWRQDHFRLHLNLEYTRLPDHYFGVGWSDGYHTAESAETTLYQRNFWQINPQLLWKVRRDVFAGLEWDLSATRSANEHSVMLTDRNWRQYGPENLSHGLGLLLQRDTRDLPSNAWRGSLLSIRSIWYLKALGSDNHFSVLDLDLRKYLPVAGPGRTLALQFRLRDSSGRVPWSELSQLGTSSDLRGYREGRFRDRTMLLALMEYRHTFKHTVAGKRRLSNHGLAAWLGAGSLAARLGDLDRILPDFGLGYRLAIQPRMNLRLDFGFGKIASGWSPSFYFNFNEAF